jgi:hypothetical protein
VCDESWGRGALSHDEAEGRATPHPPPELLLWWASIVTPQIPPALHPPCSPRKKGSSYRMSGADTAANHAPLDASAFVAPRNLLARPALSALDKEQIDGLVGMETLDARADADADRELSAPF